MMYSFFSPHQSFNQALRIGECPSNSPFLKNNVGEPIAFKEWRDTRTFSNIKTTHYTLLILLIINPVAKNNSEYIM